jgi:hypothetical protein
LQKRKNHATENEMFVAMKAIIWRFFSALFFAARPRCLVQTERRTSKAFAASGGSAGKAS